ncbi:hypothetical protein B0H19DRAFT_1073496 [Mycena capillaripes]|nr:hypothetical protein B0H19DRAFT_1073496 [Mycena capillaripes]
MATAKYSHWHARDDDVVGRVSLPHGLSPFREHRPTAENTECKCILYEETKNALDVSAFLSELIPTPSDPNKYVHDEAQRNFWDWCFRKSRHRDWGRHYLPERPEFFDLLDRSSQSAEFQRNTSWVTDPFPKEDMVWEIRTSSNNLVTIVYSCEPNVIQRWYPGSLTLSVRALSHIHKGEELLAPLLPRANHYSTPKAHSKAGRYQRFRVLLSFMLSSSQQVIAERSQSISIAQGAQKTLVKQLGLRVRVFRLVE